MRKQKRRPDPSLKIPASQKAKWVARWSKSTKKFSWPQHKKRKLNQWFLPDLKAQTDAHCSYCDGYPVEGLSLETIDHFKPKAREEFRQFAFEWGNLFYCCSWCQKEKGERFCSLLLKPDDPDYEFGVYFYPDYTKGEILPHPDLSTPDRERVEKTIEILNLNSDSHTENRRLELNKWMDSSQLDIDKYAYRFFLPEHLV